MYIAIEYNDDGSINDEGSIQDTPEKAWEIVSDIFYAPDTKIYKLSPYATVKNQRPYTLHKIK